MDWIAAIKMLCIFLGLGWFVSLFGRNTWICWLLFIGWACSSAVYAGLSA